MDYSETLTTLVPHWLQAFSCENFGHASGDGSTLEGCYENMNPPAELIHHSEILREEQFVPPNRIDCTTAAIKANLTGTPNPKRRGWGVQLRAINRPKVSRGLHHSALLQSSFISIMERLSHWSRVFPICKGFSNNNFTRNATTGLFSRSF